MLRDTFDYDISISIHALCEEGDMLPQHGKRHQPISIHALCEEGDEPSTPQSASSDGFLSTPSARRATWNRSTRPSES